ncbi:hypothetical protein BHM03_00009935 [Ensete ventricosum]|nr:hypothetical protein BHM03_00009935 [Ensete ventricosum]
MCLAPCDCRALKKKLKERMSEFQVASNFHIFQMIFCFSKTYSLKLHKYLLICHFVIIYFAKFLNSICSSPADSEGNDQAGIPGGCRKKSIYSDFIVYVFVNPCVKFLEFTNFFHSQMQVMDTLAEIHERHNTVKDLERKLLELQQVDHTISNF